MFFDGRSARLRADRQHFTQVHSLAAQFDLAGADATDIHEVINQVHQMIQLSIHHLDYPFERRVWSAVFLCDLQAVAQRCEWVSQFMGKGCEKFVLAPVTLAKRFLRAAACGHIARGAEPFE